MTAWLRVGRKPFFPFFCFFFPLLVLPFMRWQTLVQWAEGKYEVKQGSRPGEDVGKPRCLVGGWSGYRVSKRYGMYTYVRVRALFSQEVY